MKKNNIPTLLVVYLLSLPVFWGETVASGTFTLRDYDRAVRTQDMQKLKALRSYILGAVETHLMYSKMLKNRTDFNALCTGNDPLNINELGALFEIKITTLRPQCGEDIMGMPVVDAVPMIVEEHYRCF